MGHGGEIPILVLSLVTMTVCVSKDVQVDQNARSLLCRDRSDYFSPQDFRVSSCTMCLMYLFTTTTVFRMLVLNNTAVLIKTARNSPSIKINPNNKKSTNRRTWLHYSANNRTEDAYKVTRDAIPGLMIIKPDVEDLISLQYPTVAERSKLRGMHPTKKKRESEEDFWCAKKVENELEEAQRIRWLQCCQAANACCKHQLKQVKSRSLTSALDWNITDGTRQQCPITWDGFSCVKSTDAGVTADIKCPSFIFESPIDSEGRAMRRCMVNGSWWVNPESLMEWTDYSKCAPITLDIKALKAEIFITIGCNGCSILLLVPAVGVFLIVRPLRSQQRIKLHSCLFLTLLLSAGASIVWQILVIYGMLVRPLTENIITTHPTTCKFLNMVWRFTRTSTFFWMFCEGFQLHWLMVKSLKPVRSMMFYLIIGWGIPAVLIVIYLTFRAITFNQDSCWLILAGGLEWLVDGPTIACIGLNVIFLVSIMKALWSQLKRGFSHVGSLRRALRAMFILIPLFGLQQFCILYRPHVSESGYLAYAVASAFIVNLQGAVVALLYCFLNSEVQTHLREALQQLRRRFGQRSPRCQSTMSNTLQTSSQRRSLASLDMAEATTRNVTSCCDPVLASLSDEENRSTSFTAVPELNVKTTKSQSGSQTHSQIRGKAVSFRPGFDNQYRSDQHFEPDITRTIGQSTTATLNRVDSGSIMRTQHVGSQLS